MPSGVYFRTEQNRNNIRLANLGKKQSRETCEKRNKTLKGRKITWGKKISKARKGIECYWKGKKRPLSTRIKMSKGIAKAFKFRKPTSIELKVQKYLKKKKIKFEQQKSIWRYIADIYIPSKNLIIECDGTYWHSRPEAKKRDAQKDVLYKKRNYNIIRLSEIDINNNSFKKVIDKL